jgi:hypothetical protein
VGWGWGCLRLGSRGPFKHGSGLAAAGSSGWVEAPGSGGGFEFAGWRDAQVRILNAEICSHPVAWWRGSNAFELCVSLAVLGSSQQFRWETIG